MFQLTIHTEGHESHILIGESLNRLSGYLPTDRQVIIVTDSNILKYYGDYLRNYPLIEIGTGEKHKTMDTLSSIYTQLLKFNADRNSFIVAVGGGIVCDVTGFAASTYMRGIPFGFVSTTLLSQVDASVGGKNGINFGGLKNMIGTFNQPLFVICDTEMIKTLPDTEYISGFAEIVKAAVIRDESLFEYLEQHAGAAIDRDPEIIRHQVTESVKIKARVVELDEHEHGERRILNFGHTFGHAIETLTGISHGAAVSIGMMIAARWSVAECGFPREQADRLKQLLLKLGLPVTTTAGTEDILKRLVMDKKRESSDIHLVLLDRIGSTIIRKTPISEIEQKLEGLLN